MMVLEREANPWRCNSGPTANFAIGIFRQIRWTPEFAAMSARSVRIASRAAPKCLPELRRRFRATPDPADNGMASGVIAGEAPCLGEARASVVQPRGHCRAFGPDQEYASQQTLRFSRTAARSVAASTP